MRGFVRWSLFVFSLLGLIACGGSGGGSNSGGDDTGDGSSSPIRTGILSEVVVAGLPYRTETQSGVTSARGEFLFKDGETITFFIGQTPIGFAVKAKDRLRLLELFPGVRPYTNFNDLKALFALPAAAPERIDFNLFHNTLFLLEAFDRNSDLSNGVEISSGVLGLLERVQFDLQTDLFRFVHNNPSLVYFRNRAGTMGLVGSGAAREVGMVLDAYYGAIELGIAFFVPVGKTTDFLFDGILDEIVSFEYDFAGNPIDIVLDSDREQLTQVFWSATYNQFGQKLSKAFETEALRVDDEFTEYEYDPAGNLILLRQDLNGDGVFDRFQYLEYQFGDFSYTVAVSLDVDGNGELDDSYTVEYQLDDAGHLQEIKRDDILLASFAYWDNGRLKSKSVFAETGGEPVLVTEFDGLGRVVLIRGERGKKWDGVWEIFYGSRGNVIRKRFVGDDFEQDNFRLLVEKEFNRNGDLVLYTVDFAEDGVVDLSREYFYNDDDQLVREVWYEHTDLARAAIVDVTYEYDRDGRVIKKIRDDLAFDTPEDPTGGVAAFLYSYDELGNLIAVVRDERNDGLLDVEKAFRLRRVNWRAALLWIDKQSLYSRSPFEELPGKWQLLRRLEERIQLEEGEVKREFVLRDLPGVRLISVNCSNPFQLEFFDNGEVVLTDLGDLAQEQLSLRWSVLFRDTKHAEKIVAIVDDGLEFRFHYRRHRDKNAFFGQPSADLVVELKPLDSYPLPYACTFRTVKTQSSK